MALLSYCKCTTFLSEDREGAPIRNALLFYYLALHTILSLIVMFFASLSWAGETVIHLHTVSYHLDRDDDFNEVNYGFGVRHYTDDARFDYFSAGGFKNSEHRPSYYTGVGWEWPTHKDLKLGVVAGVITGYERLDPAPFVAPVFSYKRVSVLILPYPSAVLHLTVDIMKF